MDLIEPLTPAQLEDVNPGVRKLVTLLRKAGFNTCDSGDGKTHTFECDREYAYVVSTCAPGRLIEEANRLGSVMCDLGVNMGAQGPDDSIPCIQASYDPAVGHIAFIDLMYVTDGTVWPHCSLLEAQNRLMRKGLDGEL